MSGFLGTGATFRADLNLVIQLAMGLALLTGMWLARTNRFKAHKYCQATVILLNLPLIFLIMAPSFHRQVEPSIPDQLHDTYFAIATIHAVLGTIAQLLGLYIVLVAATRLLPAKLRFKKFKPWMRTELVLWWSVILLGVGTYYFWYVKPADTAQVAQAARPVPASPGRTIVRITNFQFEPKEVKVAPGSIVEWVDEIGRHTVEADDGSFKSETMAAGGRYEHRFDNPGRFPYFCTFHGDKGGMEMAGLIIVTTE